MKVAKNCYGPPPSLGGYRVILHGHIPLLVVLNGSSLKAKMIEIGQNVRNWSVQHGPNGIVKFGSIKHNEISYHK